MARKYFGTDGIRGRVGEAPITPDFVMRLGYAAGKVLAGDRKLWQRMNARCADRQRHAHFRLYAGIGASGRTDGGRRGCAPYRPTADTGRGLSDPRLAFAGGRGDFRFAQSVRGQRHQVLLRQRQKLPDQTEQAIEASLEEPMETAPSRQLGKRERIDDAAGRYIEFCKSTFPSDMDLRGLRMVVDCANGATYHIAPHVLHELGADVIAIGAAPNGFNINLECGATHPETSLPQSWNARLTLVLRWMVMAIG